MSPLSIEVCVKVGQVVPILKNNETYRPSLNYIDKIKLIFGVNSVSRNFGKS